MRETGGAAEPLPRTLAQSIASRKAPLGEAQGGLCVASQASQQLACVPAHASPPFGALHLEASGLVAQVTLPFAFFLQQVTKPGLPHVDFAAHFFTWPLQLLFVSVASACSPAHFTNVP